MLRHKLSFRLFLLVVVLSAISHIRDIASAGESKSTPSRTTQGDTPLYVAVMGQVARPGVFELPGRVPQLAEFLNLAGGITPQASGSIRVIRGGRSNQYYLSAKLNLQLLSDDLVIVESKQFLAGRRVGNSTSATGWQGNSGALSAAPAPAVVQIGLVNLISRPVILDLPCEQANLAQVLSLLHQPVADKSQITLIKPGSGIQNVSVDQAADTPLASGMVLVFDPATVNSAMLPRLPETIPVETNSNTAIDKTSAQSAVSQSTASQSTALDSGLKGPVAPADNRPSLPALATSPAGADSGNPPLTPDSFAFSPAPVPGTHTEPSTTSRRFAGAPADPFDSQTSPETVEADRSETEPAAAPANSAFSVLSLVVLTGIVACLLGMLFSTRFKRRPQPVAPPSLPEPFQLRDDSLETLLSGTLPTVEEPLPLPYETEIFGRPLEASLHRTDSAQTLSGPHSIAQPSPPATAPRVVAPETKAPVATAPDSLVQDRKFRVDMRHPRSTASVLDRALATFEGDQL